MPCHKVVLCAASPFFQSMFDTDSKKSCSSEIEFTDVDVSALVQYMYTGKVVINKLNVQELIQLSDQLEFNHLKKRCAEFLLHHLEPSNCISLCRFAEHYELEELAAESRCFVLKHLEEVITKMEFIDLSEEELIKYISDDSLAVPDRNVVFQAALAWTKGRLTVRKNSFPSIINHVQLASCTNEYLRDVVRREPLMDNLECQKALIEALCQHHLVVQGASCSTDVSQGMSLVVIGGVQANGESSKSCLVLKEDYPQSWKILTEMPHGWRWFSACVTPEGIMLTGGCDRQLKQETKECWMLETKPLQWKVLPPMAQTRCEHGSVYHQEAVFVIGGKGGGRNIDVERYDLHHKKWAKVSQMMFPLQGPLVVSCGPNIFVMSGHIQNWSKRTQEYDPLRGKWSLRAEMPEICPGGCAVSLGKRIYVVGGRSQSCMLYQPSNDMWVLLARPLLVHHHASALEWQGRIIVSGGQGSSAIEEYDPKTGTWSVLKLTMKEPVHYHEMLSFSF